MEQSLEMQFSRTILLGSEFNSHWRLCHVAFCQTKVRLVNTNRWQLLILHISLNNKLAHALCPVITLDN